MVLWTQVARVTDGLLLAASMENEHVRRPKKRCPREGGSAHAARM